MALVKAICPNCNEMIEIESNDFNVVCKFCGVPFMPKEGIDKYNHHIATMVNNLNVDTLNVNAENIKNYATLGIAALKEGNHEKCGFYADDILRRSPSSPEGLLFRAFFVSNNYSKEEGFRCYFLAYENVKDQELKTLILDTFKANLEEYSSENAINLLNELQNKDKDLYLDFYKYALTIFSSSIDTIPVIEDMNLAIDSVVNYLEKDLEQIYISDNYKVYVLDNLLIYLVEDKVNKVINLSLCDKSIEKYLNKKEEIKKVSYFIYLNERVMDINLELDCEELEKHLTSHNFEINTVKKGCYVATCVYGSYNTAEVWLLRRFRDQCLDKSFFGKLFIKLYYAVSPTIIRLFKNNKVFHKFNKWLLDKMICSLKKKGYSNLPYRDLY